MDHRSGAVLRNQKYKRNRGQEVYLQGRREDLAEVRKEGNFSIHSEGREFPPKGSTSVRSLLSEMGSRELNKMRRKNHSRRSRARKEDGKRVLP